MGLEALQEENPDEVEVAVSPLVEPRDDDLEIEVIDDTPEADRGHKPLPEEELDALENDAETYSNKVQRRFDELTKARHDERRLRESRERELQEAANVTRHLWNELQNRQAPEAKKLAELQIEKASKAYSDAFEEGDAEAVVKAQSLLNKAEREQERAEYAEQQAQQQAQYRPQQQPQQQPQLSPQTQDWMEENPWFFQDEEMTGTAMGYHEKLLHSGVTEGSPEYFKKIDTRMREIYPSKFDGKRPPATVVAPAGRTPRGKKVVLTESMVRYAKTLGLTTKQYAAAVAKMQRSKT